MRTYDVTSYLDVFGESWDANYDVGDNYLPLINSDGITLQPTQNIILSGAPTTDLHASTKKYVDDSTIATLTLQQVTDHGAITTTATEFQGTLTVITPTADMHTSTKKYVDEKIVTGNYTGNGGASRVIDSTHTFKDLTIVRTDGTVGAYRKFTGMAGMYSLRLADGVYTNSSITFTAPGFTVFNLATNVNLATYLWIGYI
jgi:hypothetical protein